MRERGVTIDHTVRRAAGGHARFGRLALVALSLATALWLAAEIAVSVTERSGSWPVAGFAMFSAGRAEATTFRLEATTTSGRRLAVAPADFGFRYSDQLDIFVWTRVYDRSEHAAFPAAGRWLQRLAAAWDGRHPAERAAGLTLDVAVTPLGAQRRVEHHLVRWPAQ
jgi:hypothetical protein